MATSDYVPGISFSIQPTGRDEKGHPTLAGDGQPHHEAALHPQGTEFTAVVANALHSIPAGVLPLAPTIRDTTGLPCTFLDYSHGHHLLIKGAMLHTRSQFARNKPCGYFLEVLTLTRNRIKRSARRYCAQPTPSAAERHERTLLALPPSIRCHISDILRTE